MTKRYYTKRYYVEGSGFIQQRWKYVLQAAGTIAVLGSPIGGMFEMENPFRYGGLVTGRDFVDRESELKDLMDEIRSGTNVVLFSPRRMGKSSLLAELMRRQRGELLFVYVDLYGITTETRMVEAYMTALVTSVYGTARKIAAGITEVIKGSRFRLVINDKGEPGVEFSVGQPSIPDIQDMLDIPEEIARKRGKRIVVMFDEFQEIASLDGVSLLKAMRSKMQTHKHVSYVFAGSKRHLLMTIFEEEEGAFFKSAKSMELGPIPRADFVRFMMEKFAGAGGRIDREAATAIVDATGGNSYYAQQVAHELFNISTRPSYPVDVESAISTTLEHQSPAFNFLWDSVKSMGQRRYLLAAAHEGKMTSRSALIEKYGLKSVSHMQKAARQLDARGITEGGAIVDPILALWLKRLPGPQSLGH